MADVFIDQYLRGSVSGDYNGVGVPSSGALQISERVPDDFVSLDAYDLINFATSGVAGGSKNIDLRTSYGADGESNTANTESDLTSLYLLNDINILSTFPDMTNVLTGIAAGDRLGLEYTHAGTLVAILMLYSFFAYQDA